MNAADSVVTFNFSDHFIEKICDHLMEYRAVRGSFNDLTMVFGGKRPALFIKRELAHRLKTAFVPPRILSMDEFINDIFRRKSDAVALNDLDAAYELFAIARRETPEILKGRDRFARFWPWAREILGFIDQVDLEKVDDNDLLNIQAQAEIGYDVPEPVNRLLTQIVHLRRRLHQFLDESHTSRRGRVYGKAAEFSPEAAQAFGGDLWFCNFFYLHRTEEEIIRNFLKTGRTRLFFQGDDRRWPVLKGEASRLGISIREGAEVIEPDYDLKVYRAGDGHAEAAVVRSLVESMSPSERKRAVIVLPDAERLVTLLTEVSSAAGEFNVSMGYPLKRSSLYTLLTLIFDAQLSRQGSSYYARDYLRVMRHPFLKNLALGIDPSAARILSHKIEEALSGELDSPVAGRLFLPLVDIENRPEILQSAFEMTGRLGLEAGTSDLKEWMAFIHQKFFRAWEHVDRFDRCADVLEELIVILSEKSFMNDYPLNAAIARRITDLLRQWRAGRFSREIFEREDVFGIFIDAIGGEMTAFAGTPLKGLQVLGLFETRSLNFDHVIIVDLNEGSLPRLQAADPLIPREVTQVLGLARLEIDEEIQRYQFLRLLSSAKSVHLIYRDNRESEPSRFIEQLMWAKDKIAGRLKTVDVRQTGFVSYPSASVRSACKTPEMIAHLKSMTFSPSGINTYLRNPYEFYERYILGIREEEDRLDEPGAREIGTFMHGLLEEIFTPWIGRKPVIDADFRKRADEIFERSFADTLARSMKSDAFLVQTIVRERLKRLWDHEVEDPARRVCEILALEKRFTQEIVLPCGAVRFVYVVDRIDRLENGIIAAIDYKTGGSDLLPAAVETWKDRPFSREMLKDRVRSFQIPLYHHYLRSTFPGQAVDAALYNMRTLELKTFLVSQKGAEPEEIDRVCLDALNFILEEIFNPEIDFVEDPAAVERSYKL